MQLRKIAVGAAGLLGVLVVAAAAAWACTTAGGPFVNDMVPNRNAVGTAAEVKGGGWAAVAPVQIGWRTATAEETVPLATAETDRSGAFTLAVRIPDAPAGVHYLAVSQNGTTRAVPFEVTTAGEGASAPAQPAPSTGKGLAAVHPLGLTDLEAQAGSSSSSPVPVTAAVALGALALFGMGALEMRRRRLRAIARH